MIIALKKLCLFFYFYYNTQVLVTAKMSSPHILKRNICKEQSIKRMKMGLWLHTHTSQSHYKFTNCQFVGTDENLIETPGCTIPNIWTEYQTMEANNCKNRCGIRGVFIKKLNVDNKIKFTINKKRMETLFGQNPYKCCSRFAKRCSSNNKLVFTDCKPFVHDTRMILEQEIITVTCELNETSPDNYVYEDAYILVQKRAARKKYGKSWNVLLIGMDTMSRGRAIQSMPKLVKYFKKNGWLDYKAFHKAEANTYPNLMITHTGMYKADLLSDRCRYNKSVCNELFIWSKFKSSGFVTAYGQDTLSQTFDRIITNQPTDHYTRPFFLLGTESFGNVACLRTRPCAYHILDYVYQLAKTYKNYKYFGSFWTSHYSHETFQIPTLLQNRYINLFKKLNNLGTLNNTIIFFYGDHGVRYGPLKIPVASFYDERLPMLYMWFPHAFRQRFEDKYHNLQLNQHRLTTHSDLHSTLWNILKLSDEDVKIIPPEYCPSCGSLFEVKPKHRSCKDIGVTARWCSCYVLNKVNSSDITATLVPEILLYRISKSQNTEFEIKKILRHHWFRNEFDRNDNIVYHVIALQVKQADKQFEGVIKQQKYNFDVLGSIDDISPPNRGSDTSPC